MPMSHPMDAPPAGLFVVRLLPLAAAGSGTPLPCVGQLEHVLSGRRHDFADGAALLECLAHELRHAQATAAALPPAPARPL